MTIGWKEKRERERERERDVIIIHYIKRVTFKKPPSLCYVIYSRVSQSHRQHAFLVSYVDLGKWVAEESWGRQTTIINPCHFMVCVPG